MKVLKAYLLVLVLIAATVAFGFYSSFYLAGRLGLRQNWLFPAFCLLEGWGLAMLSGTPLRISGGSGALVRILLGGLAGVIAQLAFLAFGLRRPFAFHDIALGYFFFQITSSFAEEYLYRGAFQNFLASRLGSANSLIPQLAAAALVAFTFATVRGLNPIVLGMGGFDYHTFTTTAILGLVAGAVFAKAQRVDAAFGVRVAYNLIGAWF